MEGNLAIKVKKAKKVYDRIVNAFVAIIFFVLTVICFVQVVGRYVFNVSPAWTEEMARYLMVWLVFVGSAIAYRYGTHLGVDYLIGFLPKGTKRAWAVGIHVVVACLLVIYMVTGARMLEIGSRQVSSAMRIPMFYPFLAVPVGGALMLLEGITQILMIILEKDGGGKS